VQPANQLRAASSSSIRNFRGSTRPLLSPGASSPRWPARLSRRPKASCKRPPRRPARPTTWPTERSKAQPECSKDSGPIGSELARAQGCGAEISLRALDGRQLTNRQHSTNNNSSPPNIGFTLFTISVLLFSNSIKPAATCRQQQRRRRRLRQLQLLRPLSWPNRPPGARSLPSYWAQLSSTRLGLLASLLAVRSQSEHHSPELTARHWRSQSSSVST